MKKIELMAPAGSLEILKAAVDCGADAVYLGINAFNARINASNFSYEDLRIGCNYAHLRNSKVYLTLNTLVNDYEINDALETAYKAYECGVDQIIVQDIGLGKKIIKKYPEIELVCSTQMNVFDKSEFSELSKIGYKRVVLPRELSLEEIRTRTRAAKANKIETEVFVHGAICVCYSGLCLFSSMNKSGSRSGNRGLCAQPCRQEYDLYAEQTRIKSGHLISPKDKCAAEYLPELISAGVASLKIEGRMRDVNYVSAAVISYRKLIDAYYEGTYSAELVKSVYNDLLVSFNRGGSFTTQYLSSKKDEKFLSGDFVGKYGLRLGFVKSTDAKKGTITFSYNENLPMPQKGNYLSIRNGSIELCSFPIGKIHEMPKSLAVKGLHPEIISKIRIDDKPSVFLMSSDFSVSKDELKKTPISLSVKVDKNSIYLSATVDEGMNKGIDAEFSIDFENSFEGNPLPIDRIESQLRKTGDTAFRVNGIVFENENMPVKCKISDINELRRETLANLSYEILDQYNRDIIVPEFDMFGDDEDSDFADDFYTDTYGKSQTMVIIPSVNRTDLTKISDFDIYCFSIYDFCVNKFAKIIENFMSSNDAKLSVFFPDAYHDFMDKAFIAVIDSVKETYKDRLVSIIDSKHFVSKESYGDISHVISAGGNFYNSTSINEATGYSDGCFVSYELSPEESYTMLKSFASKYDGDFTLYLLSDGYIPWMQSHFCPLGEHKSGCRSCFDKVDYRIKSENNDLVLISRSADCSSSIWGPCRNYYDEDMIVRINELGLNTVSVSVIL